MAGIKRKEAPSKAAIGSKKQKIIKGKPAKTFSKASRDEPEASDISEDNDEDFGGFADGVAGESSDDDDAADVDSPPKSKSTRPVLNGNKHNSSDEPKKFKLETSSADAHKAQRALAKERKLAKPNADSILRTKKLWEQLRRKSHVLLEERKTLVVELFDIIQGNTRDFVFKHDSVRVVQCALKYANKQQRREIVTELKGDIRPLVQSKYGKFLVAKMVVEGDQEVRDMVVPEFYGHVKRLINHPEASWIVDDIYRQIASPKQKAVMLTEWYGAEFALMHKEGGKLDVNDVSADLVKILEESPEKRKPILQFLHQMINALLQKKMTGFTMLHDAMLQYMLALVPGSEEHSDFLELLKSDIDKTEEGGGGDLFKNLSFTKSGSRVVCLALAYGNAKDRKVILRCFRNTVEMMACDSHAKVVLCVGLDVTDDTKTSGKAVLPELVGDSITDETLKDERLLGLVTHLHARLPILYSMAGMAKWLIGEPERILLDEVHEIRKNTSKKDPEVRRKELVSQLSPVYLGLVARRASGLTINNFGCQFIAEILLECPGEKAAAMQTVAELAAGDVAADGHVAGNAAAGRMLKSLVLGGKFDPAGKKLQFRDGPLAFGLVLYPVIREKLLDWACGDSSFVVVAMLESQAMDEEVKAEILDALKMSRNKIEKAAKGEGMGVTGKDGNEEMASKKKRKVNGQSGNAGARILLGKIKV